MWGWCAGWASSGGQERWWQWKTKFLQMKGENQHSQCPTERNTEIAGPCSHWFILYIGLRNLPDLFLRSSWYIIYLKKTLFNTAHRGKRGTTRSVFQIIRNNQELEIWEKDGCWLSCRWRCVADTHQEKADLNAIVILNTSQVKVHRIWNDYSLYTNNFWNMNQKYPFLEYERAYVIVTQQKSSTINTQRWGRVERDFRRILAQAFWGLIERTCVSKAFLLYASYSCQKLALFQTWTMSTFCQTSSQYI